MSSDFFLRSWSFVWAFQCRLLRFSLKLSEAVCFRLDISCGLRHRFEEFEKLKLVWTFQCCLLQLLTNLIELSWEPASFDNKCHLKQSSKRSERACMSSEILLKSWSFVWAFQCRLLRCFKNLSRCVTLFQKVCVSSEILWKVEGWYLLFNVGYYFCEALWSCLSQTAHSVRSETEIWGIWKVGACMNFPMLSVAACYKPNWAQLRTSLIWLKKYVLQLYLIPLLGLSEKLFIKSNPKIFRRGMQKM